MLLLTLQMRNPGPERLTNLPKATELQAEGQVFAPPRLGGGLAHTWWGSFPLRFGVLLRARPTLCPSHPVVCVSETPPA